MASRAYLIIQLLSQANWPDSVGTSSATIFFLFPTPPKECLTLRTSRHGVLRTAPPTRKWRLQSEQTTCACRTTPLATEPGGIMLVQIHGFGMAIGKSAHKTPILAITPPTPRTLI